MDITVTFRHLESTDALRDYAREKVSRIKKYVSAPADVAVVLSLEKHRHQAEITLNTNGITVNARDVTEDMYAAIDGVLDKLERQLKRYKDKIKKHKPLTGRVREVAKTVFAAQSIDEGHPEPTIIKSNTFHVKPMSVEEAVMQMDLLEKDFLVFTDSNSAEINVVYRRKDGNYGLIVPQS